MLHTILFEHDRRAMDFVRSLDANSSMVVSINDWEVSLHGPKPKWSPLFNLGRLESSQEDECRQKRATSCQATSIPGGLARWSWEVVSIKEIEGKRFE
jgi:hypothetical protein